MKIRLISHACVLIDTGDVRILCDPWLFGKAFNESWALFPVPSWEPELLDSIDYLWISHEHPDHFHIPTLKSFPEAFRRRVTVLFQKNNSNKMFRAFERFGYPKRQPLPHRGIVKITPATELYCYQEGSMNSCLLVRHEGDVVLNINDAELRSRDCKLIRKDIGRCDVVLNQFSIAGYDGRSDHERHLRDLAQSILQNMVDNHRDLGARTTIPFASFVYFCVEDNRYINNFANKPADIAEKFAKEGLELAILSPGGVFDTRTPFDPAPHQLFFSNSYLRFASCPFDIPQRIELPTIIEAFSKLCVGLHERYPMLILRWLRPVRVRMPDLSTTIEFSIAASTIGEVTGSDRVDVVVNSQPLHFAFANPFGLQTLGVSARMQLRQGYGNWKLHRILLALNNAELYLRPRHLFSRANFHFIVSRLQGGIGQLGRMMRIDRD